jgi:hypothetical protein
MLQGFQLNAPANNANQHELLPARFMKLALFVKILYNQSA